MEARQQVGSSVRVLSLNMEAGWLAKREFLIAGRKIPGKQDSMRDKEKTLKAKLPNWMETAGIRKKRKAHSGAPQVLWGARKKKRGDRPSGGEMEFCQKAQAIFRKRGTWTAGDGLQSV